MKTRKYRICAIRAISPFSLDSKGALRPTSIAGAQWGVSVFHGNTVKYQIPHWRLRRPRWWMTHWDALPLPAWAEELLTIMGAGGRRVSVHECSSCSRVHTGALSFLGGLKEHMNLEAKNGGKRVEENALGRYRVDLIKTYYRNVWILNKVKICWRIEKINKWVYINIEVIKMNDLSDWNHISHQKSSQVWLVYIRFQMLSPYQNWRFTLRTHMFLLWIRGFCIPFP